MQLMLNNPFGMQTTAADIEWQGVLSKMYEAPRRAPLYSGLQGLGISVADMIANCGGSGSQNCDPHDSSCVAVASALNDWAQNELEANFPYGPATMPACPDLSNTAAITDAFMHNTPVSLGPQTGPGTATPYPDQTATGPSIAAQYAIGPQGQHIISAQSTATGTLYVWSDGTQSTTTQYGDTPAKVATSTTPPTTQTTPMPTGITNTGANLAAGANGGAAAGGSTGSGSGGGGTAPPAPSSNWFTQQMITGIPNWTLIAAAGVGAVFIFKSKGR